MKRIYLIFEYFFNKKQSDYFMYFSANTAAAISAIVREPSLFRSKTDENISGVTAKLGTWKSKFRFEKFGKFSQKYIPDLNTYRHDFRIC